MTMHATATKPKNPLLELLGYGQSIWYDYIRRGLITSGELERLISEDGLRGVTSNPSIWEKAINGSTDYAEAIAALRREGDSDPAAIYERLAIQDLREAADAFRPIYDETERGDGYVSIEVAPELAHETEKTIAEGERLWQAIERENLMVKVPATPEGIPAIRALTARGINVNITLLFAVPVYEQVADAYISGLEDFAHAGGDVSRIASVASFFVSRIDTLVDARLEEVAKLSPTAERRTLARGLEGKVAIANAKLAYQHYKDVVTSDRWQSLANAGAHVQRLLWASTSTKNPRYPELLYVEELIGPDTVNTVPPATFEAFREHGRPRASIEEDVDAARDTLATLAELGISLGEVTDKLTEDGIDLFDKAFDKLFGAIAQSEAEEPHSRAQQQASLPGEVESEVGATIAEWGASGKVRRLWSRDSSLWTGSGEGDWLGWLGVVEDQLAHSERFAAIVRDVKEAGFTHALLLGMGGSSLFPELLSLTFGKQPGFPELHVLDSTDPAQVKAAENKLDLASTLFIVSSKSGTTLEPNIFEQYFFQRVSEVVGSEEAAKHFMAITDPGSKLEQIADELGFRHVAQGVESIGGRYSALSDFGMVPGAVTGVDVHELLDRAEQMAQACASCVPAADNPGLALGATIGTCARSGRDKITLVTSPAVADLGAWLEQLLAESTGKQGRGVVPIDREPLGEPDAYGPDRLFIYVRLSSAADAAQDRAVEALEAAGHPVVRIELADLYDLGGEVFRWEFATAVAGAVLGINPFDQPDVEAAKVATRELTEAYEQTGALPKEEPIATGDGLELFADERNRSELAADADDGDSVDDLLRAHLARITEGDYLALLAFVEMTPAHEEVLTEVRRAIRDSTGAATCLGFGPRFLHSTGQAYKGGPESGVFLQITCDDASDLQVPGQKYSFGVVKAAQARGDFQVLAERGRRALRIHVGKDVGAGLAAIRSVVDKALPR
jgi:transaldolase/glucose-6-phosphate isomerase